MKLNVHMRACTPYIETFGQPEPLSATQWIGSNEPTDINPVDYVMMSGTPSNIQVPDAADWPDTNLVAEGVNIDPVRSTYSEFAQTCNHCYVVTDGKTKAGAMNRMRAHVKKEHPDG